MQPKPSPVQRTVVAGVPERPSTQSVLEACSLLNALTAEERAQVVNESFLAYAERGETVWLAGAPSAFVAVSGVGFIKMTRTTPQGSEVAVELLGPGQCFGLLAVVEGRVFPLSAVAVTNTWYLKIPSRTFMQIYHANTGLRDQMLRSVGPRLRKAHDMMARLSTGRVEQRMAAVLLILMDSYGRKTRAGITLTVPLTRQDLAEMAGTTVETSIRVMSRWQKEGVVTTDHQVISIANVDALNEALLVP